MKRNNFNTIASFLFIMLFYSTSCKKEDPDVPDYMGTWTSVEPISIAGVMTPIKSIITLTETTFFHALQTEMAGILIPGGETPKPVWTDFFGVKGSMSFKENEITRSIAEIGIYYFNPETKLPEWDIYKDGDGEFELQLLEWGLTKTIESQYTIAGHQMTLQTDLNKDGDYEDENETIVYKKET